MALLLARPDLARAHLIRAAGHSSSRRRQHWWLSERPRAALLLRRSAVAAVGGVCPNDGRRGRAGRARRSGGTIACARRTEGMANYECPPGGTLFEHCVRAITRDHCGRPRSPHRQLRLERRHEPRRTGGTSESTWLGFFLHNVSATLRPLPRAERHAGRPLMSEARRLDEARTVVGRRGTRGHYDDGTPLGSAQTTSAPSTPSRSRGPCFLDVVCFTERHGRRSHVSRRAAPDSAAAPSAIRSVGARPGYIKGPRQASGRMANHAAVWIVMASQTGQR
jgi:hypothetical protein